MGGAKKIVSYREQTFSGRMEPVRGQSVAWRSRYPRNGPSPARKPRVWPISLAGYPIFDLARFGLQGPRVCPAQRGMMVLGDTSTLCIRQDKRLPRGVQRNANVPDMYPACT